MFNKKIFYVLMVVIMLTSSVFMSGCGEKVETGGILTVISDNVPTNFGYPVEFSGFSPYFACQGALESLWDADINGNLRPQLATSWEIADDKLSITFTLREGVLFHDGTPFNAEAAKWNLDLYLERGTGNQASWESVEVLGEYEIRINLTEWENTQMSGALYFISPTAVEANGSEWAATHPVGTGPFKFKEFVRDTSLEYERFDDYWGDKARVDGIQFIYIVDPTTAAMSYQAGEALVWESADPATAYDLEQTGYQVSTRRGPIMNLVPDSGNPDSPWADKKVREAAEYAINRQAIVDALGYGYWEAVNQPNAPEQFGHVDDLEGRSYDPDKARELMAESSWPNGFTTKILTMTAFDQDPLVVIQADLAAIGITAELEVLSPPLWSETRTGGWENGLFYVTHGATDYNYCAYLDRYFNPTGLFAMPVVAYPEGWLERINEMLAAAERDEMADLAQALVRQFVDEVMAIPLWIESEVYVLDNSVHDMGVGTHGDGFTWDTNKVWISTE